MVNWNTIRDQKTSERMAQIMNTAIKTRFFKRPQPSAPKRFITVLRFRIVKTHCECLTGNSSKQVTLGH